MGLRNITIARKTVSVGDDQSFEVRGLSLTDLMRAMGDYGPQMALAFGKITAKNVTGEPMDSTAISGKIRELAGEFPDLLAAVIALAADDYNPEMVKHAKTLPLTSQIVAIETIFGLTFQSEGELGKLVETLTRGLVMATGTLNQVRETTLDGIGAFGVN